MSRILLVELCRIRLFRATGRLLYRLTAAWTTALCRRLENVKAVYLVGSMASGDISPGLSDIDIVIVIEDLPADQELRLLHLIERRLRFVLPPYGKCKSGTHVFVYARTEWLLLGDMLTGKRSGTPKIAFENPSVRPEKAVGHITRSLHHLFKAFWRLQDLQSGWFSPSESPLSALLRLRMCERMAGALENAWEEVGLSPHSDSAFAESINHLRSEIDDRRLRRDDRDLATLLPNFLDAMDRSIQNCLPRELLNTGSFAWRVNQEVNECDNYSRSLALVDRLEEARGTMTGDHSIHVSRLDSVDLVTCDPASIGSLSALVDWFARNGDQTVHFVSFRMLQVFYLSNSFGPFVFFRLKDRRPFIATGELNPERFFLESYALFPRVRALDQLSDSKSIHMYTQLTERLIRYAKGISSPAHSMDITNAFIDEPKHFGGSREHISSVHSRFRCLTDQLTEALERLGNHQDHSPVHEMPIENPKVLLSENRKSVSND